MSSWAPVLVVCGVYLASLLACMILLGIGLAVAGKSLGPLAGYSMMGVVGASALVFLLSVGVVYWRLGSSGVTVFYAGLAVLSTVGVAFVSAVAFNR